MDLKLLDCDFDGFGLIFHLLQDLVGVHFHAFGFCLEHGCDLRHGVVTLIKSVLDVSDGFMVLIFVVIKGSRQGFEFRFQIVDLAQDGPRLDSTLDDYLIAVLLALRA